MTKTSLTEQQQEAINHHLGPALVVAGPGAGKTFVITERVKNLITKKNVEPKNILVTTFTEKAAIELKIRLAETIGRNAESIHISTIHSFCKSMLEKYFIHTTYGASINVLDAESQKLLLDLNKVELGLAYWDSGRLKEIKRCYNFMGNVSSFYDTLTRNNIDPDVLLQSLEKRGEVLDNDKEIIQSYKKYRQLLEKEKWLDFSLLQTNFYNLITTNSIALEDIQNTFKFILVDEYQDTSPIQDKIFRLISKKHQNLFVVGDENQSIYGFRGASIRNFRNFIKHYPNSKEYLLNVNFRSTETIVKFSNEVFEKGVRKVLDAKRRQGEKIKLIYGEDSDSTARTVVEKIMKLKKNGIIKKYGDIALLFRSLKYHAPEYINYLEKYEVPFVTFGDGKFMERNEIRTMIYLMSYVTQVLYLDNNFKGWTDWWRKDLFLTDFFDLSDDSKKIISEGEFSLYKLKEDEDFKKVGFTNKQDILKLKKINRLKYDIERERESFGEFEKSKNSLLKIFYKILDYSGYFEKLIQKKTTKERELLYNLGKLSEIIGRYMEISKTENMKGFLWYIYNTSEDIDQHKIEDNSTVKLMTVHKAKGLEFPVVFLCCLNEGRFPLRYREGKFIDIPDEFFDENELKDEKEEFYQEEQRLFYVGITRAQDNLIFSASKIHKIQKLKKSRFLDIISDEFLTNGPLKIAAEKEYSIKKNIPNLNYSAINAFVDCPFRYTLTYDYGFVTPPSFMQGMGTFIHNALQIIHEAIKKKNIIPPAEMKKLVEIYWIELPTSKKINDNIKKKQINRLVNYYIAARDSYSDIIAIEESFSHIDNNMIIKGKIDLIAKDAEGNTCLIDFKARKQKGIEKTNVIKQLQIYDYCLDNEYKIDKLIAYTFEDNQKTEFPIDHAKTKKFLLDISKKMAKEDFHKQKNDFCKDCQFKFYCWGDKK